MAKWRFWLGPWPNAREIQVACVSILLVCLFLTSLSVGYGFRGLPAFGHEVGGDFLQFYVAGSILNGHPHEQLYDLQLQHRLQHALRPRWRQDLVLVYAQAPWLAILFQPIAYLPYIWAYILWLAISAGLYIGGLVLIWPRGEPFDRLRVTALLISVSFFPFAFECWFGGQLSVIGFFALALCIRCQQLERLFASGAALALCTYKPTLLLLVLPMLAAGRRLWTLLGFMAGVFILGWISVLTIGVSGCAGYIKTLRLYGQIATGDDGSIQQLVKYIDMNTSLRLLFGGPSPIAVAIFVVLGGTILVCLVAAWVRSDPENRVSENLLWAMTIAWTLVINAYVPIYDSILIVLSAVLMAGMLYGAKQGALSKSNLQRFHISLMMLYLIAFVTQYLARLIRVQLITLNVTALGVMAFRLWWITRRKTVDAVVPNAD
jgi:hypothetical protein